MTSVEQEVHEALIFDAHVNQFNSIKPLLAPGLLLQHIATHYFGTSAGRAASSAVRCAVRARVVRRSTGAEPGVA